MSNPRRRCWSGIRNKHTGFCCGWLSYADRGRCWCCRHSFWVTFEDGSDSLCGLCLEGIPKDPARCVWINRYKRSFQWVALGAANWASEELEKAYVVYDRGSKWIRPESKNLKGNLHLIINEFFHHTNAARPDKTHLTNELSTVHGTNKQPLPTGSEQEFWMSSLQRIQKARQKPGML